MTKASRPEVDTCRKANTWAPLDGRFRRSWVGAVAVTWSEMCVRMRACMRVCACVYV